MEKGTVKTRKVNRLVASFLVLALCCFMIYMVSSSFFTVRIKELELIGDDGLVYTADIYIPKTATNANPAPAILFCSGGDVEAEYSADWGVELARRGYVVILTDGTGRGTSEWTSGYTVRREGMRSTYGEVPLTFYDAMKNFPIIDTDNITIIGHSIGTNTATGLVLSHPGEFRNAIFVLGMGWKNLTREEVPDTNIFAVISLQEHYWRGETDESADATVREMMAGVDPTIEDPQMGVMYGDPTEGTGFLVKWNSNNILHTSTAWSGTVKTEVLNLLDQVSPAPNPISNTNILSYWRDIFGALGIAAMTWFIIELALALLKTKTFSSLKVDLPQNIGIDKKGWIASAIYSLVIGLAVYLLATNYLPQPDYSPWFNLNTFKQMIPYFLVIPIADGVCFYFLFHRKKKKEGLANARNYGLAWDEEHKGPDWIRIGKAALVGLLVAVGIFTWLGFIKRYFGINIQTWFQTYSSADLQTAVNSWGIILLFVWVFFLGQLPANIIRRSLGLKNEKLDLALSVLINVVIAVLPIAFVGVTQAIALNWHSTIFAGTNIQNFYALPIGISVATTIHTVLYRKTGTIWVGLFVCAIFMGISTCATHAFEFMFLIG